MAIEVKLKDSWFIVCCNSIVTLVKKWHDFKVIKHILIFKIIIITCTYSGIGIQLALIGCINLKKKSLCETVSNVI